jgi:membrane-associated phospholipid phosphatase
MSTVAGEAVAAAGTATRWRAWLIAFAAVAVTVLLCVAFVDRPLALLAEDWFGGATVRLVKRSPSFFWASLIVVAAVFALRRAARRPFGRSDLVFLLCGASLIVGEGLKPVLKYLFGRPWPKYAHPSFIRDGVYGFNPFHAGYPFESFPSGHMTIACAVVSVLWIYYPRFRPVYAACVGFLALALVSGNYHFLSDTIAGGFVGASVGILVVWLWERFGTRLHARAGRLTPS